MLKRYSFAIGLLTLFTTSVAHAQTCPESSTAQNLLTITPAGHYTRAVIKRATDGITEAQGADPGEANFGIKYFSWTAKVTGAMLALIDTQLRLVEYERDLTQATACLHLDLAIIEAKMEEVRCETRKSAELGSTWGVLQLLTLQNFLNESHKHLSIGGLDPNYKDPQWQSWQIFDKNEDVWCCPDRDAANTCEFIKVEDCRFKKSGVHFSSLDDCSSVCKRPEAPSNQPPAREEICPFDTNYFPPTGAGYGCSIDVLNSVAGYVPAQVERDALQNFVTERDDFLNADNIAHIKDAYIKMLNFQGRPIPPEIENFGKTQNGEHLRRLDCGANKIATGPLSNPTIEPVAPDLRNTWPQGAIAMSTRGPFAIEQDNIALLRAFFDLSQRWSLLRDVADYLQDPYDLPAGDARDEAIERDASLLGFGKRIRQFVRTLITQVDKNQAGLESAIFPKATDGQLRLIEIMSPIRPSVASLATSVSSAQSGIRGFAMSYAYYIRRSCIFRPCSERLEKIMKILLAPECFPYTTGAYVSGKWWEQCEDAVE